MLQSGAVLKETACLRLQIVTSNKIEIMTPKSWNSVPCLVRNTYLKVKMIFQQVHLQCHTVNVVKRWVGDDDLDIPCWP